MSPEVQAEYDTRARVTDVHTEHCCVRHGCKYTYRGRGNCTVADHGVYQSGPCDYCWDEIAEEYAIAVFINEMYEKGRAVGREEGWAAGMEQMEMVQNGCI